ncbi:hypothetical protein [Streptacidiphilus sp. P02-A3a]|uniref:hypothetical protein n=1 Tax=Streptacidiphilus sp. P02-A3a TaxID=2704468 RepID=UPI0015FDDF08|nr:hypothetical protein [Streptacidiphilus sp. P02-A3a]QMU69738.1 hypothetical protein GXP74_17335 [Streptacidiphilus sp. P02-A3a]
MAEYTGKSVFEFPDALSDDELQQVEKSLAQHGAQVDARSQAFTPSPEPPSYAFTCLVDVADQMAADNTAAVVLRRALYDCDYLPLPPPPPVSDGFAVWP